MATPQNKQNKQAGKGEIPTYFTRQKAGEQKSAIDRLLERAALKAGDVDPRDPQSIAKAVRKVKPPTASAKSAQLLIDDLATLFECFTVDKNDAEGTVCMTCGGEAQEADAPVSSSHIESEKRLTDVVQKATSELREELLGEIRKMTTAVETTATNYRDALTRPAPPATSPAPAQHSPIDPRTLAKIALQRRKFYARIGPGSTVNAMRRQDLIPKANDALHTAIEELQKSSNEDLSQLQKNTYFKAITVLRADSVSFEMNTETARNWMFSDNLKILHLWLAALGDTTLEPVKPSFGGIAFNVPLSHDTNDNREIEQVNEYEEGAVNRTVWAKNPEYRSPHQLNGHLIIEFATPEAANRAFMEGLIICSKRVTVEKRRNEPPRCRRCNKHGHYVGSCREIVDAICGSCGGPHTSAKCTASKHFCSNCKEEGHAVWDRTCRTFLAKCAEYDARNPENAMPFYVTDELWTHRLTPPSEKPAPSFFERAQKPARGRKRMMQSTISWATRNRDLPDWHGQDDATRSN